VCPEDKSGRQSLILLIGATDSSGGAGLFQDQRTAEALGCPVRFAVSGITVQGRGGVSRIFPSPTEVLRDQILTVFQENRLEGVRIGALCAREQISLLGELLLNHELVKLIVGDPVFSPTQGVSFLNSEGIKDYRGFLSQLDFITPNREELALLGGRKIDTLKEAESLAHELAVDHDLTIALTGGHFDGDEMREFLVSPNRTVEFVKKRLALRRTHGTGCCFATALTVFLRRNSPEIAFQRATKYVSDFMK
jgi:hydroxymethylpyrimidine/phosphomethylpyrimidine kinase